MSTVMCKNEGCPNEAAPGSAECTECLETVTDDMIRRASIPNAAALLRRAARQGLIQPTSGYAAAAG